MLFNCLLYAIPGWNGTDREAKARTKTSTSCCCAKKLKWTQTVTVDLGSTDKVNEIEFTAHVASWKRVQSAVSLTRLKLCPINTSHTARKICTILVEKIGVWTYEITVLHIAMRESRVFFFLIEIDFWWNFGKIRDWRFTPKSRYLSPITIIKC